MNTNYNLRKALYTYLDVKFDSDTQISIANGSAFKVIKVEDGSFVNIFISAQNGQEWPERRLKGNVLNILPQTACLTFILFFAFEYSSIIENSSPQTYFNFLKYSSWDIFLGIIF